MSFEYASYDQPTLDMPPQLAGLMGLQAFGVAPLLIGGAVAAGTLAAWLAKDGWSVGEYNNFMRLMNDTIQQWDKLGWTSSCWKKDLAARAEWKAFWTRFSKHYREYGQITPLSFLSDSEEGPARTFMQELQQWAKFFERCGADIGVTTGLDPESGVAPVKEGGMGDMLKYGAWLVGGLVALNVITGLRGGIPRRA